MIKKRPTQDQKRIVAERAHGCCEYCRSQARYATQSFSTEHIEPPGAGGKTELDNLAFACQGCNGHKYNKTKAIDPVTKKLVPLFHPRRQKWNEHFQWSEDFTLIMGITPTGRATIAALKLNRESLANLRGTLFLTGKHPSVEPAIEL